MASTHDAAHRHCHPYRLTIGHDGDKKKKKAAAEKGSGNKLTGQAYKDAQWPKTRADALARGFKWGTCSKADCSKEGAYDDPNDADRVHRHAYPCSGYFGNY